MHRFMPLTSQADVFDALPNSPPDIFEHLRLRLTDQQSPSWPTLANIPARFALEVSLENGSSFDPLQRTHQLLQLYAILLDKSVASSTRRCENAVRAMMAFRWSLRDVEELAVGVASPIREALRACQLCPPGDWPTEAYILVGRSDLARMSEIRPVVFQADSSPSERRRFFQIIEDMRAGVSTDVKSASGVELNIGGFTDIRFGEDRRLHEVARMLQSSAPPSVAMPGMADIRYATYALTSSAPFDHLPASTILRASSSSLSSRCLSALWRCRLVVRSSLSAPCLP